MNHCDENQSLREPESYSLWICCWLMVRAINARFYRLSSTGQLPPSPQWLTSEEYTTECKQGCNPSLPLCVAVKCSYENLADCFLYFVSLLPGKGLTCTPSVYIHPLSHRLSALKMSQWSISSTQWVGAGNRAWTGLQSITLSHSHTWG